MTRSEIIAGSNKISGNVILRDLVEEGFANLPCGRWGSAQRLHYLSGANALCAQKWNSIIWRQENSGMREPVKTGWLPFVRCMGAARQVATLCAKGFAFLCPEDNMSQDLAEKIAPHHKSGEVFPLIATQGTGILSAPVSRLRGIGHSTFARSSLFSREVLRSTALVLIWSAWQPVDYFKAFASAQIVWGPRSSSFEDRPF
jgi:hypothetical protein